MYSQLRQQRRGGGVIVYVHNTLCFTRHTVPTYYSECVIGEIETTYNTKIGLCAVYRPPNLNKTAFVEEITRIIGRYPSEYSYVLLGDMNINLCERSIIRTQYLNSLSEIGLVCGISQYTRVETRGDILTKSCIDHIFLRAVNYREVHTAVINNALADHYITGCAIVHASNKNTSEPMYKNMLDNKKLEYELRKIKWDSALDLVYPNDIFKYITDKFSDVYNKCMKSCIIKIGKRQECKWVNTRAINMSKKKQELLQICKQDENNKLNRLLYNRYRNLTNKYMEKTKNNYIKKDILNNFRNQKKVWEIINNICGRVCKSVDDVILKHFKNETKRICNTFAYGFDNNVQNICSSCDVKLLPNNLYLTESNVSMRLKKTTNDVIQKLIMQMNKKKSPGIDNIRARDLLCISAEITPVITHLINACISTSLYPDPLKIGIIRPIHKKGSYSDVNNYRPITILPSIDKIVERYFESEITSFLTTNSLINEKQYGFQKGRNTSQLLSTFVNEVNQHLNNRNQVLVVFIDFSKAFDTLNYPTLFSKLNQVGIRGPLLEWFHNYHTNRNTVVRVNGQDSDPIPTLRGTAQGSILGPTEYLIYVNDMCNLFTEGSVFQFADDTCLVTYGKNVNEAEAMMQCNFDILCKWAHDVGLVINANKTKIMHIHSPYIKTDNPVITAHSHTCLHDQPAACACAPLELVDHHTYLGLVIDKSFNWKPHVDHLCNKLRSLRAKMNILKYKIPYNILRLLYLSLADSIISYGLSSYGRTYKTNIDCIYKLQLSILKTIVPTYMKNKLKDESSVFKYCKVMSIFKKFDMSIVLEEYDKIKLLKTRYRHKQLRTLDYQPRYILPNYINVYGKRTWEYMLPNILNNIPEVHTSVLADKKSCKIALKRYYITGTHSEA